MPITQWPSHERPRERLLLHGASCLSDAELLAIFLRTGMAGKSAVDLARDLITHFGSIHSLLTADQTSFCKNPGVGSAKYAQLQAVMELARRHLREPLLTESALNNPNQVKQSLQSELSHLPQEVFHVLFLDNKHRILRSESLFHGTIHSSSVHPREVIRKALEYNAAALIVAHNHPSGVAEPSFSDIQITEKLRDAVGLVDIRLLDHIVVGRGECVSLAERGHL